MHHTIRLMENYYFGLIVGLVVAFWIYKDAQKRKLNEAVVWAVVGFLFGLLGLLVYYLMVMRPNKQGSSVK